MKVYITKYALTQGIYEIEAKETREPDMIKNVENSLELYHGKGKEWHLSKEDAIKKAEEMKQKKIKSLKTQIEKFEKMTFRRNVKGV